MYSSKKAKVSSGLPPNYLEYSSKHFLIENVTVKIAILI